MFDKFGNDSNRYNIDNFEFIAKTSPKVAELIKGEYERQRDNIELIASENYCSEAVLAACEVLVARTDLARSTNRLLVTGT